MALVQSGMYIYYMAMEDGVPNIKKHGDEKVDK